MKGGASIESLIDLALSNTEKIAHDASKVLKTQVFLYETDMKRLEKSFLNGNKFAEDVLKSYASRIFHQLTKH